MENKKAGCRKKRTPCIDTEGVRFCAAEVHLCRQNPLPENDAECVRMCKILLAGADEWKKIGRHSII